MQIDWFIVGVIVAVIILVVAVYRYHTRGQSEIAPSSYITEALTGLEAPKSVDPEDDPLGALQPMLDTFHFTYPERDNYFKVKKEHGDSKPTEQALFQRALGCVAKIIHMQKCFPILQQSKQSNILPDDIWNMTQMKMKEIDDEYQDIRKDADAMVTNGGATIFQEAMRVFQAISQQHQQQQQAAQQTAQQQAQARAQTQATLLEQSPTTSQDNTPRKRGEDAKSAEKGKKAADKQKEKPVDTPQTAEQKKAAAERAYKELLREEAAAGKKPKKSKKDE